MKRLKFETQQQLEFFCLNTLSEIRDFDIDEINEPKCFSIADVVKDIADTLMYLDVVKIEEFEGMVELNLSCQEGCTRCDKPKQ